MVVTIALATGLGYVLRTQRLHPENMPEAGHIAGLLLFGVLLHLVFLSVIDSGRRFMLARKLELVSIEEEIERRGGRPIVSNGPASSGRFRSVSFEVLGMLPWASLVVWLVFCSWAILKSLSP